MALYDMRSESEPIDEIQWCDNECLNICLHPSSIDDISIDGLYLHSNNVPTLIKALEASVRILTERSK